MANFSEQLMLQLKLLINKYRNNLQMFPNFIITFRETLEASLIVGIILGYLAKTNQTKYNPTVYLAIFFGVATSIAGAYFFSNFTDGFTEEIEQVFEGITMLVASSLIATMIFWMLQQKDLVKNLTEKIAEKIKFAKTLEIFLLIFFAILREGIEIVLFLSAVNIGAEKSFFWASFSGIVAASIIGLLVFRSSRNIDIKLFFNISTYLLIFFGAGLFAHGIHEFQEVGAIPYVVKEVWNVNHILDEKGVIGSFLKDMFGYNGNPSLIETSSYLIYLSGIIYLKNYLKSKSPE